MPDFNEIIGEMYLALNEEALVASVVRTVKLSGDVRVEINLIDFYISHYFFLFRTFLTCFFHSDTDSCRQISQEAPSALQCSNAKHSPISAMVTPKIP